MFIQDAQEEVSVAIQLAKEGDYNYLYDIIKANKGKYSYLQNNGKIQ